MVRKAVILILMLLYIYTLTFDIFLNTYFTKIPAPIIFGFPLVALFFDKSIRSYWHGWETLYFLLAILFFYGIGQGDFKTFLVNAIVFTVCGFYFNFFVGHSSRRFNVSVVLFVGFLIVSALVMFADHQYTDRIDSLRIKLLGSIVVNQSPSGISSTIFTFGYQAAALVGFLFVFMLAAGRKWYVTGPVFLFCLIVAYYGMQRSVFIGLSACTVLYFLVRYGLNAVPALTGITACCVLFFLLVLHPYFSTGENIFNKNSTNMENGENRQDLFFENLKICSDYPFGLIFYGKDWKEVTHKNPVFQDGLTSHNAYMMFFTYLGPVLTIILLILMFYNVGRVFQFALVHIRKKENALLAGLCFAFVSISVNALFHNAWLAAANGPSVFLYLAILHYGRMTSIIS